MRTWMYPLGASIQLAAVARHMAVSALGLGRVGGRGGTQARMGLWCDFE